MSDGPYTLVMAIYPSTRGFAYALFEGVLAPVDWGISELRGERRNETCLDRIAALLKRYAPDILVLRGGDERLKRGGRRAQVLIEEIEVLAKAAGIATVQLSRDQVRRAFAFLAEPTRYAIIKTIVHYLPELEAYVPAVRKIWQREHPRMVLFDAMALALTFYGGPAQDTGPQRSAARVAGERCTAELP